MSIQLSHWCLVRSLGTVSHWKIFPHLHYQRLKTCSRHIFSHVLTSLTNCFTECEQQNIVRRPCGDSSHVTVIYYYMSYVSRKKLIRDSVIAPFYYSPLSLSLSRLPSDLILWTYTLLYSRTNNRKDVLFRQCAQRGLCLTTLTRNALTCFEAASCMYVLYDVYGVSIKKLNHISTAPICRQRIGGTQWQRLCV